MSESIDPWDEFFAQRGRVFLEPHEDTPGIAQMRNYAEHFDGHQRIGMVDNKAAGRLRGARDGGAMELFAWFAARKPRGD